MALDKNRRSLNTAFYNDPYIENLDRNEHDIFLTLLLNPQNNLAGVYEISIKKLASYAKMEPEDVRNSINNLMDDGKIIYINSWVAIKNHIKNQSINPKMAKNILEILKQVPMQMKVFVLLNDQGELEKWSKKLLEKLADHYNTPRKIECKKNNIDYIPEIHGMKYTQEQFLLDINGIENSINSNNIAYQTLSNPLIKKKEEIGNKKEESERRNKKEEKEISDSVFKGFQPANNERDYSKEYKPLRIQWNDLKLPECRYTCLNLPNWSEIMNSMQLYTFDEIEKSITNYSELITRESAIRYSTFPNFLVKGIQKYADSSMPYQQFKESEEERLKKIKADAWEKEKAK